MNINANFLALFGIAFSSGSVFIFLASSLPLLIYAEQGSTKQISILALITIPYSLKILWAPYLDHNVAPFLHRYFGHRKAWALFLLFVLLSITFFMPYASPNNNYLLTCLLAALMCMGISMIDTISAAYRAGRFTKEHLPMAMAFTNMGFYTGLLLAGAGSLYCAAHGFSWRQINLSMLCLLIPSFIGWLSLDDDTTAHITLNKPANQSLRDFVKTLKYALKDLNNSYSLKWLILFILFYKISDSITQYWGPIMFLDLGFSKSELAFVVRTLGTIAMLVSSTIAGKWLTKAGIMRGMIGCGILQLAAPLALVYLGMAVPNKNIFIIVVIIQAIVCGMAHTALMTFLTSLCKGQYIITKIAIVCSLASFMRTFLTYGAGYVKTLAYVNWPIFFIIVAIISLPFLYVVRKLKNS